MRGAALVLTGGRSARMGSPKARLAFAGGTFLSTIIDRLRPLALPLVAVVRGPDLDLEAEEFPGIRVLLNPHQESGPIGSLQVGLAAGAEDYPWIMAIPVDHPAVQQDTYLALAQAAAGGGAHLWAPSYQGRRGHPVVFGHPCYEDLGRVPPGEGARWVVARHREHRAEVQVDDPGILRNVDTPADYHRLLQDYSR